MDAVVLGYLLSDGRGHRGQISSRTIADGRFVLLRFAFGIGAWCAQFGLPGRAVFVFQ
jgi:hypothetical protein